MEKTNYEIYQSKEFWYNRSFTVALFCFHQKLKYLRGKNSNKWDREEEDGRVGES